MMEMKFIWKPGHHVIRVGRVVVRPWKSAKLSVIRHQYFTIYAGLGIAVTVSARY
jgi:hypothetical protein